MLNRYVPLSGMFFLSCGLWKPGSLFLGRRFQNGDARSDGSKEIGGVPVLDHGMSRSAFELHDLRDGYALCHRQVPGRRGGVLNLPLADLLVGLVDRLEL